MCERSFSPKESAVHSTALSHNRFTQTPDLGVLLTSAERNSYAKISVFIIVLPTCVFVIKQTHVLLQNASRKLKYPLLIFKFFYRENSLVEFDIQRYSAHQYRFSNKIIISRISLNRRQNGYIFQESSRDSVMSQ